MTGLKTAPLTLLDREAGGGDTAKTGFTFQENAILARIPMWLARDGFTCMICEAAGDTEAKFFVPGRGYLIELVEAKNHQITPAEFWSEIGRFQKLDRGTPGTYGWFTLVSTGLSKELHPLVNGLRRLRGAYGFYEGGASIRDESFATYLGIVQALGYDREEARFLFEKVLFDIHQSPAQDHGEGLFIESISRHLPEYQNLSIKVLMGAYTALGDLVRGRICQVISRIELERRLNEAIPPAQRPAPRPVSLYTSITNDERYPGPALSYDWAAFFGSEQRSYPPSAMWEEHLIRELHATREWIVAQRATRRVRLLGNRRLSAALCIGFVFSAVAGFSVEMEYRGTMWATDAFPPADMLPYRLRTKEPEGEGKHLAVTIGILKDITAEVESDLPRHGLVCMPALHLHGEEAILSPEHANAAALTIKQLIGAALHATGARKIHLFFAGPAHLALFLGHRLNATARVQCYEWVAPGMYTPTCVLS